MGNNADYKGARTIQSLKMNPGELNKIIFFNEEITLINPDLRKRFSKEQDYGASRYDFYSRSKNELNNINFMCQPDQSQWEMTFDFDDKIVADEKFQIPGRRQFWSPETGLFFIPKSTKLSKITVSGRASIHPENSQSNLYVKSYQIPQYSICSFQRNSTEKIGPHGIYSRIHYGDKVWSEQDIDQQPYRFHVLNQIYLYIIITCAEVNLVISGLEWAYAEAPRSMKSVITAFWWLPVAAGNFGMMGVAHYYPHQMHQWKIFRFNFYGIVIATVYFLVSAWMYKSAGQVEEDGDQTVDLKVIEGENQCFVLDEKDEGKSRC